MELIDPTGAEAEKSEKFEPSDPTGAVAAASDIFPETAARSGDAVELKRATAIILARTLFFFMIKFLIGFYSLKPKPPAKTKRTPSPELRVRSATPAVSAKGTLPIANDFETPALRLIPFQSVMIL